MDTHSWITLGTNAIWIVGLALGLAAFSFALFESQEQKVSIGAVLYRRGYNRAFSIAGVLFGAGIALSSETIWQAVLGGLLVFLILLQGVMDFWAARHSKKNEM